MSRMSLQFDQIRSRNAELAALYRLKKSNYNVVATLAFSFLIKSLSFLQITMINT